LKNDLRLAKVVVAVVVSGGDVVVD